MKLQPHRSTKKTRVTNEDPLIYLYKKSGANNFRKMIISRQRVSLRA